MILLALAGSGCGHAAKDDPLPLPADADTDTDTDSDADTDVDSDTGCDDATDGTLWYLDTDRDGYGASDAAVRACEQPAGYVADGTDCDDSNGARSPAADEVCDGADDDCDSLIDDGDPSLLESSAITWYRDGDVDGYGDATRPTAACEQPPGYVSDGSDCDDGASSVHPDATELCDALDADEDCDGLQDDEDPDAAGLATWYGDGDGDGYGNTGTTTEACDVPPGFAGNALDCDDAVAAINPAAVEVCDASSTDEDCDGLADDASAAGRSTFYLDSDSDGYGGSATALECHQPPGYLTTSTDCDDLDPAVNPAATERCDAADTDEDCNGLADDDDPGTDPSTESTVYADSDGDGFAGTGLDACDIPFDGSETEDDCEDSDATIHPGAAEDCDAVDRDCDGDPAAGATDATAFYADVDGDGFGDSATVVFACSGGSGTSAYGGDCDDAHAVAHPGAAELCWDVVDGDCDTLDDALDDDCAPVSARSVGAADHSGSGGAASAAYGTSVAFVPDMNGDGIDEFVVGAPGADSGAGAVYVYFGTSVELDFALSVAGADVILRGDTVGDALGTALAGGDFDGDGLADLAVGATGQDSGGSGAGAVYVFYGVSLGSGYASAADVTLTGYAAADAAGSSLAGLADQDGDGMDELVVGGPGHDDWADDAGAAWLVMGGSVSGSLEDVARTTYLGECDGDAVGSAVAAAGDVDADGVPDLLLGAPGRDEGASASGAVYVVYGLPPAGDLDLVFVPGVILGATASDALGSAVAGAGDVDADGYDDVLIGVPGQDSAGTGAGAVGLYLGPIPDVRRHWADADAVYTGSRAGDALGTAVAGVGDVDADGYADVLLGAPGSDAGYAGGGAAYLYYGPLSSGTTSVDLADTSWALTTAGALGRPLAGGGDIDGDGYADFATAAPAYSGSWTGNGGVWLELGGGRLEASVTPAEVDPDDDADGDGTSGNAGDCDDTRASVHPGATEVCDSRLDEDCDGLDPACPPSGSITPGSEPIRFYSSVRNLQVVGDVNGDGYPDVAVIGSYDIYVFYGPLSRGDHLTSEADVKYSYLYPYPFFNDVILAAGDVNGDGYDDMAFVNSGDDTYGTDGGVVVLFYGGPDLDPNQDARDAALIITPPAAYTRLGGEYEVAVANIGDVNLDGSSDMLLAISGDDTGGTNAGAAYLFYGGRRSGTAVLTDADAVLIGEHASDFVGAVAGVGDVNGDGISDFAVSSDTNEANAAGSGSVYLFYGPFASTGDVSLRDADAQLYGVDHYVGVGVIGLGDTDADGYDDLLILGTDAFVVNGPIPRSRQNIDADFIDEVTLRSGDGYRPAAGDVNGDGYTDLVFADPAHNASSMVYYSGTIGLLLGPIVPDGTFDEVTASWRGTVSNQYIGRHLSVGDVDGDGYDDILAYSGGSISTSVPAGIGFVVRGGPEVGDVPVVPAVISQSDDADGDGYSETAGDCDDTRADVSPGQPEVCEDDLDDDCDGFDLWCAPTSAVTRPSLWTAIDASTYGIGPGDIDGDGYDDLVVSDTNVTVERGPLSFGLETPGENDYSISVGTDALLGPGDLDGDGWPEILTASGGGVGSVSLYMGDADFENTAATLTTWAGASSGGYFGIALDVLPDRDGDGTSDLVVGAPYDATNGSYAGAAYVFPIDYTSGTVTATSASLTFLGASGDHAGHDVANAGDVDGDGLSDLLLSADYASTSASHSGNAYLWLGGSDGGVNSLADADAILTGEAASDNVLAVDGVSDLDGDGYDDVAVGAVWNDVGTYTTSGATYLWYGPIASGTRSLGLADAEIDGATTGAKMGSDHLAMDFDGDGSTDLLASAREYGGGTIFFWYGPARLSGVLTTADADGSIGERSGGSFGTRLGNAGDINGDSYPDLLVDSVSGQVLIYGGPRE